MPCENIPKALKGESDRSYIPGKFKIDVFKFLHIFFHASIYYFYGVF